MPALLPFFLLLLPGPLSSFFFPSHLLWMEEMSSDALETMGVMMKEM
jgi:hypothetical protein